MNSEIIIAGFGGQGVLLSGKILCLAGMRENKAVSHIPSYGAEMRGGTANCAVVISDDEVASPLVKKPNLCIVLNKPSFIKFEPLVKPEGVFIYNTSLIDIETERGDIKKYPVPATEIASEEGSMKAANMVALGALIKIAPWIASFKAVTAALEEAVSMRNKSLNEINLRALKRGYDLY